MVIQYENTAILLKSAWKKLHSLQTLYQIFYKIYTFSKQSSLPLFHTLV